MAHAFGRPDVDQFLSELTPEQFDEWAAYFSIEPIGYLEQRKLFIKLAEVMASTMGNDVSNGEVERLFALPGEDIQQEAEDSQTMIAKLYSFV